ncbi:hypothetical protein HNO52_16925 [Billgrantia diversa]|nr:hypothetical protein HNO52_16925 [Halomonas sp. MCCC 1A13316]
MARQSSRFDYYKSRQIPELTVLQASLSDFCYDRHAHEEYAFGVTLYGRQDFFSGGEFHRSPPGNVIQFNPEQVHDGHPGDDNRLGYVMLYVPAEQLEASFADAAGHLEAIQPWQQYVEQDQVETLAECRQQPVFPRIALLRLETVAFQQSGDLAVQRFVVFYDQHARQARGDRGHGSSILK